MEALGACLDIQVAAFVIGYKSLTNPNFLFPLKQPIQYSHQLTPGHWSRKPLSLVHQIGQALEQTFL